MWKYVLKRLLIAVPTLVGIMIITFCLIHLAPGDPAQLEYMDGSFEASEELILHTRKLYGLDEPLLLNFDVKDRRRLVLSSGDTGYEGLGKRVIPYLVPLALSTDDHAELLRALQVEAGIQGDLAAWWKDNKNRFSNEAILEQVMELERCSEEAVPRVSQRIRDHLGELALPVMVDRLESSPSRNRLIDFLAPWSGYPRKLTQERHYAEAHAAIVKWWNEEGLGYREIGSLERVVKTITEAQFSLWLGRIFRLDFGESYIDHLPVTAKVWEAFKITFSFQVIVIFLIYLIAVPLGVYSAVKQDSFGDRVITLVLFMLYSLPNFWVAYLLILFLGGGHFLELFPIQGLSSEGAENLAFWPWLMDRLWHMCLPVVCMTYAGLAALSRFARTGMLEVVRKDYVRTARAKGLSERAVIIKHALRNGMIPIVTLLGGLLPALISGSVIVEYIFGIHGMGMLGFQAVLQRDYPVVMAIAFFSAVLVLIGILVSDLLYAVVDPRISLEKGERA
jgi:peptide/nickel transport system permease protein